MTALLLAAALRCTLPAHIAAGCEPSAIPCSDLALLRVWYQPLDVALPPRVVATYPVAGLEGQRFAFDVDDSTPANVWAQPVDSTGNAPGLECSAMVRVGPPLAVTGVAPRVEWFDVAGRRLREAPSAPGVYLWRRGSVHGSTVVIH